MIAWWWEWWGKWPRLRWPFYNSGWWESCCPGRVANDGDVDLMLQFQFEMGYDETKQRQWAHLDFMGGNVTWCSIVTTSGRGDAAPEREKRGKDVSCPDLNLTGWKMKKIHTVDSIAINRWLRFKTMMS
jgi:hypothetical protein